MLKDKELRHILCIDIETVPQFAGYEDMAEPDRTLFLERTRFMDKKDLTDEGMYKKQAGVWAEFGRIICICVGLFRVKDGTQERILKVKTFDDTDESALIRHFFDWLNKYFSDPVYVFAGHNIKEFDMPYICRRALANNILPLPSILDMSGKKPWEIAHIDTMERWKFGDYKQYISLKLLSHVLHIPSSKDDIDGSQVAEVYWQDNDMPRIAHYCRKDVLAVAQVLLRYIGQPLLDNDAIVEFS